MIQFTVTLSDSLAQLIEADQAPIDGIEVGPYFSLERYKQYREQFKDHKFYFHGIRVPSSSQELDQFKAFLKLSDNPWASVGISRHRPVLAET